MRKTEGAREYKNHKREMEGRNEVEEWMVV